MRNEHNQLPVAPEFCVFIQSSYLQRCVFGRSLLSLLVGSVDLFVLYARWCKGMLRPRRRGHNEAALVGTHERAARRGGGELEFFTAF